MRLFLAVHFDEQTKPSILEVQNRLRQLGHGNFSQPENFHLTLAFLGEVPAARVAAVHRAMDNTFVRPMTLTFDRVGCFHRDGGDIWWIGLRENKDLLSLQKELSGNLAAQGFLLESRRFSPHITLARQIHLTEQPDPNWLLGQSFSSQADAISLMLSQRVNGKLVYTEQYCRK